MQTKFIEQQTGLTREQIEEVLANETDPYLRQQLEELYNPLMFNGLNEAEQYFENTEDIINEEDLEESVCESRKQSPLKQSDKIGDLIDKEKLAEKLENASQAQDTTREKDDTSVQKQEEKVEEQETSKVESAKEAEAKDDEEEKSSVQDSAANKKNFSQ